MLTQEWHRHVWKNIEQWQKDFPWVQVTQTGLGCNLCRSAGMGGTWSQFKACKKVSCSSLGGILLQSDLVESKIRLDFGSTHYILVGSTSFKRLIPRLWCDRSLWSSIRKLGSMRWPLLSKVGCKLLLLMGNGFLDKTSFCSCEFEKKTMTTT